MDRVEVMWRMIVKTLIAITLIALICLSISNIQDKSFLQSQDINNMPKHYTEEALSQGNGTVSHKVFHIYIMRSGSSTNNKFTPYEKERSCGKNICVNDS